MEVLGNLRKYLRYLPTRPDEVSDHPDYKSAQAFKIDFDPQDECDYGWVNEYAKEIYERLSSSLDQLDAKADSIIKYLGGGTGLLTLGVIVNSAKIGPYVLVSLFVPLVMALIAICFAGRARLPANSPLPPTVYWAIQYAEAYGDKSRDTFLAQWNLACEGLRLALKVKSYFVSWAGWCFLATMVSLVIPFTAAIIQAYLE